MTDDLSENSAGNEATKIGGVGIRWADAQGLTHAGDGKEAPKEGIAAGWSRSRWPCIQNAGTQQNAKLGPSIEK